MIGFDKKDLCNSSGRSNFKSNLGSSALHSLVNAILKKKKGNYLNLNEFR